ncbi:MAG: hypothetical protein PHN44_01200 [Candidatus Marinimicrobia bacterium]|nr:hypothetical protein [Candidatus Neomarinimicrobiota bacterium]MDD5539089.1 hypothetical protein [Candidatus Neomarinimicrobiota bacterium]
MEKTNQKITNPQSLAKKITFMVVEGIKYGLKVIIPDKAIDPPKGDSQPQYGRGLFGGWSYTTPRCYTNIEHRSQKKKRLLARRRGVFNG